MLPSGFFDFSNAALDNLVNGASPIGENTLGVAAPSATDGAALSLQNATIGILTALPEEFQAACTVLGCNQEVSAPRAGAGRIYKLGVVRHRASPAAHIVAVMQLLDMGNNTAAVGTTLLMRDCPGVTNVVMCGIGGGIPNPSKPVDHVRLGDIVVCGAAGVRQYDNVKETEYFIENRSRSRPPSPELLEGAQLLEAEELAGHRPWDKYISDGVTALGTEWARPAPETDVLREPKGKEWIRRWVNGAAAKLGRKEPLLRYSQVKHPPRNKLVPYVFQGLIASANNLQKNPYRRNNLRDEYGAKAVEMEGSGVADAAYHLARAYFIVRGIQDYCNQDKNDDWRRYAALAAAAYTRALLEATPPHFLAAAGSVQVAPATALTPQDEASFHGAAMVQRVVVNTLVQEEEQAVDLQQTGGNDQGGPSVSTVANVEMPSIPGAPVAGVQVNVSITFASKQKKPTFPAEAAISAGLAETKLTPSVAAPALGTPAYGSQGPASSLERALLGQEAKRHIEEMISLQSTWEFARLFDLARYVSTWADEYGSRLSGEIRSQLYEQLVRVEVARARQQARPDEPPDFGRARELLRKAKHESD